MDVNAPKKNSIMPFCPLVNVFIFRRSALYRKRRTTDVITKYHPITFAKNIDDSISISLYTLTETKKIGKRG